MNWNFLGSLYGRSSIQIPYFVLIRLQTWPQQAIFVFNWSILKKCSPLKLPGQINQNLVGGSMEGPLLRLHISSRSAKKHGRHRQFLFMIGWFLKKNSPLKLLDQMNRNLVGSIYGRFSKKIAHLSRSANKHGSHRQ
jgi:hypothetical protein